MAGFDGKKDRRLVEVLESRTFLSASLHAGHAKGGGGPPAPAPAPAIRLDLVALHELGHALGLEHSSDTSSIMYPYYNANYNLNNFANDSAVATLRQIYSAQNVAGNSTAWKDSLDPSPNNGTVNLTYSFVRDGAPMDQGSRSDIFATFDKIFGAGKWQPIFTAQLSRWAGVSNGEISFTAFDPDGIENSIYAFNTSGTAQADSRFGDIRIGTHRFDGAGKVLAHTYYPPPNGATAAGDSHYDSSENWVLTSGGSSAPVVEEAPSGNGKKSAGFRSSPFATGPTIGASDKPGAGDHDRDLTTDDLELLLV